MRVVAGTHKGHRLAAPRGATTRPTSDRVREAVFNLLGSVEGARVLDLYAGSGALGIEAISRGAAHATFVDSSAGAAQAVRSNIERLGIADQARVTRASAASFLRRAAKAEVRWDLVFCDPPYGLASRIGSELGILLPPVAATGAKIVCESARRQPLRLDLELVTERRYGDTVVTIYSGSTVGEADA
jgi:16S rRNA (guanine966-N2)-methyltransferase